MNPPLQPNPGPADGYAVRDLAAADSTPIVALNAEFESVLSPMDAARLAHLHLRAAHARVVIHRGEAVACLLAFRESADYDSPNFLWFQARHVHFLYIDRVIVNAAHQGQGLGTLLYQDLFSFASLTGVLRVTAEFDVQPPNEASRLFHAKFGFREVGTQWLDAGRKQVSLQEALLATGRAS